MIQFLSDECTYFSTVELLRQHGHEVVTLNELGLLQSDDLVVIEEAQKQNRILVTRDKDFSNILNYPPKKYQGIIVLRMDAQDEDNVHSVFLQSIVNKTQEDFVGKLYVINKDKVRIES
ncbi:MAG: DUF5615 family PIN-like protein [Ignavibacteriae bacterium]|nr:DUF5615 family PIN-like protein [Ignavibacteriota bacterium]